MIKRFVKRSVLLFLLLLIGLTVYKYIEQQKELANQPLPIELHPLVV